MIVAPQWDEVLKDEFEKPYFLELMKKVDDEYAHHVVYPPRPLMFRALNLVDYENVKVVILGQDPYHGDGQANGLAFGVDNGVEMPPSLRNIYTELQSDLDVVVDNDTSLVGWSKQGVLLLNAALTVRAGLAASHANLGWHELTDAVISALNKREKPVAYILWGLNARQKAPLIDRRNFITMSAHPSPLSAHRGFFGSKPFSKVNSWLMTNGFQPIYWQFTGPDTPLDYYKNADKIKRAL